MIYILGLPEAVNHIFALTAFCKSELRMNKAARGISIVDMPRGVYQSGWVITYLIRSLPVISLGCSRPMMWRIEGATSAKIPSSVCASLFSVM